MGESGCDVTDNMSATTQAHVRLPLNLSRITAGQLRRLSMALGLTASGPINDQRLMVERKISDLGCEPCNVQVVFEEHTTDAAFQLWDESAEFLTVPSATSTEHPSDGELPHESTDNESSKGEPDKLESLWQSVADITVEKDTLQSELQAVGEELERKKSRIKDELWTSC